MLLKAWVLDTVPAPHTSSFERRTTLQQGHMVCCALWDGGGHNPDVNTERELGENEYIQVPARKHRVACINNGVSGCMGVS